MNKKKRDIKFRVFEEGKMEFIGAMDWDDKYKVLTCNTESRKIYRFDPETLNIMQYTGLKDKNGVEIYEGDVVKFEFVKGDRNVHIAFKTAAFGFINDDGRFRVLIEFNCNCVEVIGNIYENPELID